LGKLWVDDFAAFASAAGGKRWIVGRSLSPCVSEDEAFDAARGDACNQLFARMRPRLTRSSGAETDAWLRRRLEHEMARGDLIVDRHVWRVHRPYADIWSEAVLVDASNERLSKVTRDHAAWLESRFRAKRGAVGSVFGLSVTILLVYVVLNALTKGYFRGRLRAGAAAALVLVALGVLYAFKGAG
jgi:hypothetical protein